MNSKKLFHKDNFKQKTHSLRSTPDLKILKEKLSHSESSWTFILVYQTILWLGILYSLYHFYLLSQSKF